MLHPAHHTSQTFSESTAASRNTKATMWLYATQRGWWVLNLTRSSSAGIGGRPSGMPEPYRGARRSSQFVRRGLEGMPQQARSPSNPESVGLPGLSCEPVGDSNSQPCDYRQSTGSGYEWIIGFDAGSGYIGSSPPTTAAFGTARPLSLATGLHPQRLICSPHNEMATFTEAAVSDRR
jgi:hypothetical protein